MPITAAYCSHVLGIREPQPADGLQEAVGHAKAPTATHTALSPSKSHGLAKFGEETRVNNS